MDHAKLRDELTAFFDAFVAAFRRFDGMRIAQRYAAPYLAVRADGTARCFAEHADIGRYFQDVVDSYHAQGCRSCRYKGLEVLPLGRQSALATVTWELLREDGGIVSAWCESYNLVRGGEGFRIFASVDHAS